MVKSSKKADAGKVGYKNPPKNTQWQKGQSGNPSGKPKKEKSFEARLKKLAAKEIIVQLDGAPVSMTQEEIMLHAVFQKANKGDLACIKFIAVYLGTQEQGVVAAPQLELTEADLAVLQTQADWLGLIEQANTDFESGNASDAEYEGDDDDDPTNGY